MFNIISFPSQAKTNSRANNYAPTSRPILIRNRVNCPLVTNPTIDPYLISRAAAVARMRSRRERRLDAYTFIRILSFACIVTQRVSELNKMTPRQARTYAVSPKPKGYVSADLKACYRLQRLRQHYPHTLSQQANSIITDALQWYSRLCAEMRARREAVPLFY